MKLSLRSACLFFAGGLLLIAALAVAVPPRLETFYAPPTSLSEWLPPAPAGWTSMDKPIAESEEVRQAVDELLNFSDGVFRVYRKNERELSVYIAYWEPGKMDPRLVAVHSPDVCWVAGGWAMATAPEHWAPRSSAGNSLGLGELRTFAHSGNTQNVVFWHLVGGLPSGFMGRTVRGGSFWSWEKIMMNPRAIRREQWFIRLSTNGRLTDFEADPLWNALIDQLSLAAKSQPTQ